MKEWSLRSPRDAKQIQGEERFAPKKRCIGKPCLFLCFKGLRGRRKLGACKIKTPI